MSPSGAIFCRAAVDNTVRPGDTSWAVKGQNDPEFVCGCNSGGWTGKGAFYGGHSNPTYCGAWGGGWAGVKSSGQQKGDITQPSDTMLWVR